MAARNILIMNFIRVLWIGTLLSFFAGCAVAPLSNHVTGRSLGKGNSSLDAGTTIGNGRQPWLPTLKYAIGLNDNLDFGAVYEVISIGLWTKYAFINRKEQGFSLAGIGGAGLSGTGEYLYTGPVFSYRFKHVEPYIVSRFNYVRYSGFTSELSTIGELSFESGKYNYLQNSLGSMFWFADWFGLSAEASHFITLSSPFILGDRDRLLYSASFIFRF
jgi:hypothetical protein